VGELTATTFGVEAMPLIRYRTGDLCRDSPRAVPLRAQHACASAPIVGRKHQKLKIKGTTIFPSR
jgi:phenylacetate-CoA ligase